MDDRRAMVNFAVHARLRAIQRRLLLGPTCGRPVLEAARHDNARKGGLIVATVIVTGADRGIDAALVRNYHRAESVPLPHAWMTAAIWLPTASRCSSPLQM